MLGLLQQGEPDLGQFGPQEEASTRQFLAALPAVVEAGPEQFDDQAARTLLGGSLELVEALTTGECDGFLE